jgi:hypothetical protein
MQLTKLRAAPVLQAEVPPCAPAGKTDGGTASQLIASVGWTNRGVREGRHDQQGRAAAAHFAREGIPNPTAEMPVVVNRTS